MEIRAKEIKLVKLSDIKLNPKNRNKHPAAQVDHIARIISKTGFRRPGTISNRTGLLVCGEGRYHALKKLKAQEMPVMYQDYESEEQEYADGIADNALDKQAELDNSMILQDVLDLGPDFDFDLLGIPDFKLPEDFEPQCDEDAVPEHVEPKTKLGDLYQLGSHRLLCGDSTNIQHVQKVMKSEKADMVFTDPPYGIGFKYNSHQDTTGDEYKDFCRDWFHILKMQSDFIVISTGWAYNLFWYEQEPKDTFYWLCRNKRTGGSASHFRKVEPLFIWGKPENRYDFDFFEQTHQIEPDLKGQHTCPKPVSLIEAILEGCKSKGRVLDVFGGSGTTMIACEKKGLSARLIEIDPRYTDVIVKRWENYTGKKAELINEV